MVVMDNFMGSGISYLLFQEWAAKALDVQFFFVTGKTSPEPYVMPSTRVPSQVNPSAFPVWMWSHASVDGEGNRAPHFDFISQESLQTIIEVAKLLSTIHLRNVQTEWLNVETVRQTKRENVIQWYAWTKYLMWKTNEKERFVFISHCSVCRCPYLQVRKVGGFSQRFKPIASRLMVHYCRQEPTNISLRFHFHDCFNEKHLFQKRFRTPSFAQSATFQSIGVLALHYSPRK